MPLCTRARAGRLSASARRPWWRLSDRLRCLMGALYMPQPCIKTVTSDALPTLVTNHRFSSEYGTSPIAGVATRGAHRAPVAYFIDLV